MKQEEMSYGSDYKVIPATSVRSGMGEQVLPDVFCQTVQIVNVCMVGTTQDPTGWVLVDAGMPGSAQAIISAAEGRFGAGCKPKAIVLTHGHFDHVGSILELVKHWNVPVYAHELEMPYLTGKTAYPKPDATVEGGMVAKLSPMFPNEPINLSGCIQVLPQDHSVPGMEGWRWIHTPGHTPGHISLFRDQDRALIAGDAFVTVKQEYLYEVLTQDMEISGPPRYLTTDWQAAKESVLKLEQLKPQAAVTGHGIPLVGTILEENLRKLAANFDEIAVPDYGRFAHTIKH